MNRSRPIDQTHAVWLTLNTGDPQGRGITLVLLRLFHGWGLQVIDLPAERAPLLGAVEAWAPGAEPHVRPPAKPGKSRPAPKPCPLCKAAERASEDLLLRLSGALPHPLLPS